MLSVWHLSLQIFDILSSTTGQMIRYMMTKKNMKEKNLWKYIDNFWETMPLSTTSCFIKTKLRRRLSTRKGEDWFCLFLFLWRFFHSHRYLAIAGPLKALTLIYSVLMAIEHRGLFISDFKVIFYTCCRPFSSGVVLLRSVVTAIRTLTASKTCQLSNDDTLYYTVV